MGTPRCGGLEPVESRKAGAVRQRKIGQECVDLAVAQPIQTRGESFLPGDLERTVRRTGERILENLRIGGFVC